MATRSVTDEEIARWWPVPTAADHKYTRGVLGIITGSARYPGAGVLGVRAALACGPGMVRYLGGSPLVVADCPEVVPAVGQVQAWLAGSGMDSADGGGKAVRQALAEGCPTVLDAGSLSLIFEENLPDPTIICPHPGELAQLWHSRGVAVSRAEIEADLVGSAQRAARDFGVVVALTAHIDVIANPHGETYVQSGACGWRATAGAGDVYAGITGALLAMWAAQDKPAVDAAWIAAAAAHIHGRAANLAAGADHGVGSPIRASMIAAVLGQTIGQILQTSR